MELEILRHSTAHILAQAVKQIWPGVKLGIGPSIEEGFYYDFDKDKSFIPDDLLRIEKQMQKIIKENFPLQKQEISKKEAIKLFKEKREDYKLELLKEIPETKLDQTYLGNIYHSGLKHFFRNIRDVTRYINSLRFGFEMVKNEVNAIDFLAITAIQVFIPEVYYGIKDNKDIFSGVLDSAYEGNDTVKDQAKKRCDEIIGRAKEPIREILKDFLKRLFPKLESIYNNINYGSDWLDNWRRDSRICSPDIFDIFFRLSLSKGEISKKEIETILSLGNNPNSFAEALLKFNEDGRIIRFLDRLEDYTRSDIPEENIEPIITVLMDIGDLFPEGDLEPFGADTPMRLLRLFYQLSHRFDTHEKRFNIFKRAIEKATRSLFTVVREVSVQGQQHGKYSPKETPEPKEKLTVNPEQLEKLEALASFKPNP